MWGTPYQYKTYYSSHENFLIDQLNDYHQRREFINQYPIQNILALKRVQFKNFLIETRIMLYNIENKLKQMEFEQWLCDTGHFLYPCLTCSTIHFYSYTYQKKTQTFEWYLNNNNKSDFTHEMIYMPRTEFMLNYNPVKQTINNIPVTIIHKHQSAHAGYPRIKLRFKYQLFNYCLVILHLLNARKRKYSYFSHLPLELNKIILIYYSLLI